MIRILSYVELGALIIGVFIKMIFGLFLVVKR